MTTLNTFNIILILLVVFVILFGVDELERILFYIQLRIRLLWVQIRGEMLRRKLRKELKSMEVMFSEKIDDENKN